MANPKSDEMGGSISFPDFPEDVQLCILSFLTPSEVSTFACISKRFVSLCRNDAELWFTMCQRRWGCKTEIRKWGNGKIAFRLLYKTLNKWENLIGFWCRSGPGNIGISSPPLDFFEWGPIWFENFPFEKRYLQCFEVIVFVDDTVIGESDCEFPRQTKNPLYYVQVVDISFSIQP